MSMNIEKALQQDWLSLIKEQEKFLSIVNWPMKSRDGIFRRYRNPVVTKQHVPLIWRYDFDPKSNPRCQERIRINATLNAGAIKWKDKYLLMLRVEGSDRKSFFAIAESTNGTDNFRFWERPVSIPQLDDSETNIYDMRLTAHEDGWLYGVFCCEKLNKDTSVASACAGIVRSRDLIHWERLPNIEAPSQQRNVVLHPEYVEGKYAFYTRPQDDFVLAGAKKGIGWALVVDIRKAVFEHEKIINTRGYHTIKELKNGEGPAPLKTPKGWLHLAHGVRYCASGLRYVLYLYLTALDDPSKLIAEPGGYLLAPKKEERIGDVSNVVFSNGWVADHDGRVLIYYASSDTRMHVAETTVGALLDYCLNTNPDGLCSAKSVQNINELVDKNLAYLKSIQQ